MSTSTRSLIDEAKKDESGPQWFVEDLAELDLPAHGVDEGFDAILCAGNVMTFLAPSTRREVLRRMGLHLRDGGRAVIGFGAGRGYEFDEFFADAEASGLASELKLGTWDLRPLTPHRTSWSPFSGEAEPSVRFRSSWLIPLPTEHQTTQRHS